MYKLIMIASIYILFLFFGSIIIHEAGHYIPAKMFGCNPKFKLINVNPNMTTEGCNNNKELVIGISGILAGFVPLLLLIHYFSPSNYIQDYYLMIINSSIIMGYIGSNIPDIVRIIKILNIL